MPLRWSNETWKDGKTLLPQPLYGIGINQENFQLNEHDQINDITLNITIWKLATQSHKIVEYVFDDVMDN